MENPVVWAEESCLFLDLLTENILSKNIYYILLLYADEAKGLKVTLSKTEHPTLCLRDEEDDKERVERRQRQEERD